MKLVAMIASLLFAVSAHARTINITMRGGEKEIQLTNPSGTVPATYSIDCYNKDGASTLSLTGQTVAVNKSTSHVTGFADTGACGGSASMNYSYVDKNQKKVYFCSATGYTYANAATACGTGQKFCMPAGQSGGCGSIYMGSCSYNVWVKNDTGATRSTDSGCTYSAIAGGEYFYGGSCGNIYMKPAGAGCSEYLYMLNQTADNTELHGATCCEDTSAGGICKVTITDATHVLTSPSFKGGTPF